MGPGPVLVRKAGEKTPPVAFLPGGTDTSASPPLGVGAQSTVAKGDTIYLVVIVPSLLSIHTLLRLPGISLQIGAYMSASLGEYQWSGY